jgi:sulfite reductase alpha subunit-like flavoprotein
MYRRAAVSNGCSFYLCGDALPNMDSLYEDIVSDIIATTGENEDIQPLAILVGEEMLKQLSSS